MKILSIETSCDDTGVAIIEAKGGARNVSFNVLSNVVISQKIHAQYGGVFPVMAKKEHIKNLPLAADLAIKKAKLEKEKKPIDAIAVTYGPGLEPCLWTGIVFAEEFSKKHPSLLKNGEVPIIPVNHMEGHILSAFVKPKGNFNISLKRKSFPMLCLLASGGHTELVLVKDIGKYEIVGKTLDDAAGEAYDKVARMLGLPYPGGPKISKLAEEARTHKLIITGYESEIKFPRPMIHSKDLNFSFAGLKTSVLYTIKKLGKLDEKTKRMIALEFENAVVDTLLYKTAKAMEMYDAKRVIVGGGVSANKHLKRSFTKAFGKKNIFLPDKKLTGDNALMIGVAGYFEYKKNKIGFKGKKPIKAEGSLSL